MSRRRPPQPVTAGVAEHPAVRAWLRLQGAAAAPAGIELVRKERSRTPVVRLLRAGEGGTPVIAKRAGSPRAAVERTMYEHAARCPSVTTPRWYGCVEDEGDAWWIFTGDAGDGLFSFRDERHRRLAARWLAELHASAPGPAGFPDRGLGYYRSCMDSARAKVLRSLGNEALGEAGRVLLRTVAAHLDHHARRWGAIEALGDRLPRGIVHGDFKARNLRVREEEHGSVLLVFDWEEAGWGLPGVDTWRVDPEEYRQAVLGRWPGLTPGDARHLAALGRLLWCFKAVDWEADNLDQSWLDATLDWLRVYEGHLADAGRDAGLLP